MTKLILLFLLLTHFVVDLVGVEVHWTQPPQKI